MHQLAFDCHSFQVVRALIDAPLPLPGEFEILCKIDCYTFPFTNSEYKTILWCMLAVKFGNSGGSYYFPRSPKCLDFKGSDAYIHKGSHNLKKNVVL